MAITTGLSVWFAVPGADGVAGHLSAEIDDRKRGLNTGRTSFAPGDTVYFLVFTSDNVRVAEIVASAGSVVNAGSVQVDREVTVQFVNTDTAQLPIPALGSNGYRWLGNSLGSLTIRADGLTVTASAAGVAVAAMTIYASATLYALRTPAVTLAEDEDYPIVVFIQGEYV